MQANRQYDTMARLQLSTVAAMLFIGLWQGDGRTTSMPPTPAAADLSVAQASAPQGAGPDTPMSSPSVTRGMGKEAVRTVWGDPEEIRKIRTCFGWQEEWVYRGDAKRFGGSERVLLFDEGDVLTEIK